MSSTTSSIHSTTSAAQCGTRYYSGGLSEVLSMDHCKVQCWQLHRNAPKLCSYATVVTLNPLVKICLHEGVFPQNHRVRFCFLPCWFMTVPQEIFLNSCRWNDALDFHTCGLCAFPYLRKTDKPSSAVTYLTVCLTFMMPHNVHIVCSGDNQE